MDNSTPPEADKLNQLLFDEITPIPFNVDRQSSLRQSLVSRVAASKTKQKLFTTVRAKDGVWETLTTGVRTKQLYMGKQGNSVLIEFAPGASLLSHRHNWLEEGIVLSGDLNMASLKLGRLDYHVSPPGSRHAPINSQHRALAYLRGTSLGDHSGMWQEILGGLLPFARNRSQTVFSNAGEAWAIVGDGLQKKNLWREQNLVSCFYQLAAGARLPKQSDRLEQEILILEGEIFMDDALLGPGDYQFAPAGVRHQEIYTDVGATLFRRGASDD